MSRGKYAKKTGISVGNILYWMVGILLVLTMLSTSLVGGLLAKYIISDTVYDSAHVASAGIGMLKLREHKAKETYQDSGVYRLLTEKDPVTENTYEKVLPGVDIPKDPFISLKLADTKVSYELYIKVIESASFPEKVTYKLTNNWKYVRTEGGTKIYQYVDENGEPFIFEAGDSYTDSTDNGVIKILEDDMLYVSEHYVGTDANGKKIEFSLKFSAYLKQVNPS